MLFTFFLQAFAALSQAFKVVDSTLDDCSGLESLQQFFHLN